ncbi:MAG TPA: hypothetical protein VJ761_15400, partial [Ktedonobacteraceae bacterium]|nr:hypothetical protein [Ktedonobacteraceae bacterium]
QERRAPPTRTGTRRCPYRISAFSCQNSSGVGCLLALKAALANLCRPLYAGGTITLVLEGEARTRSRGRDESDLAQAAYYRYSGRKTE